MITKKVLSLILIILFCFFFLCFYRSTDCNMTLGALYSRNPHSIPESLTAIPSVGSPGSAGPSPHPNSTLSQPSSIPPADQVNKNTINYIYSTHLFKFFFSYFYSF